MVMMIVNVNDGDDLGKEHEVNASPNMARHCWGVEVGIIIIHGRDKIMTVFTMMMTMMMTMMRWDGMIRLMLHLIWPDSRRFRTSLTGSLWTFLCSTIPQNVLEYICIFICS